MGLINRMADTIRNGIRNFLNINPAMQSTITIDEGLDQLADCVKNRIWYAGKSKQLSQLYSQLDVPSTMFWKAQNTQGQEIRKIHVGIPALTVNTITNIVISDFNGIEISDKNSTASAERWAYIEKKNELPKTLKKALKELGIVGDGAFKISYDSDVLDCPIIEWYPAERVKFVYVRGNVREVKFYTDYFEGHKRFQFEETYGYGYIKYKLYNDSGKEVDLHTIGALSWIDGEGVKFDNSYMAAVPMLYGCGAYEGRGAGLLNGKEDAFDSLDETWSQWQDAQRSGRTKTYIPGNLVPYNKETCSPMTPNPFDNRFIAVGDMVDENGKAHIQTESPTIQYDAYLSAYVTALDLCLQGIISPSTLGIDVKKLDNAEAQREKEKTTLYTRQNFVELLENTLPKLVMAALNFDSEMQNNGILKDVDVTVKFGEYANPSFESQIETVGKARTAGVMSVQTSVDELYGDSKDDEWKAEEVQRIKTEQGIATAEETSELDDTGQIGF